jgi:PAS domain S-box-containing protein
MYLVHHIFRTNWELAYYQAAYRFLFPLSAIFAAWRFKIKGGLIVCLISVVVILPSAFINSGFPKALIDIADIMVSMVLSWLAGQQGELKRQIEITAAELKLQSERLKSEITERIRTTEQYRLVTENSADVIYKLDIKDEKYIYVSPSAQRMFGYTEQETLTKKPRDIMTPESYQRQYSQLFSDIRNGINERTLELEIIRKDGKIIPVEVHCILLHNENGEPAELVGVARDITERKKMEEQIIMQDRLASIGLLSSGIAHEVNNPLTSVITLSGYLLAKDLPEEITEDIQLIKSEAERSAAIVKNLLTFARKQGQQKQSTNINERIKKILELRTYEYKTSNISVDLKLAPDLPPVWANGAQLEQVFFNIIINAEFFMTKEHNRGTLSIKTEKIGDFIRASIMDDGPGITAEDIRQLFTPFFTTKEVGKGTGLGLSVCHGIITEHGGKIWAESQPGQGATFIIELPVYKGLS